jgi:hypothetical protein
VLARNLATDPSNEEWRYPPSWVDRLGDWIEQLLGRGVLVYVGLGLLLPVLHAVIKWADGSYPVGTFVPFHVVVMVSGVWFFALPRYLNWAARQAMNRFRPAMKLGNIRCVELEYRLTTMPGPHTWLVTVIGLLFGWLVVIAVKRGQIFDPTVLVFTSPLAFWFESAIAIFICVTFALLIHHTVHQVRVVNHIYTTCTAIDLYNLAPVHAFSVLTAQTAVGLLPVAYAWIATEPVVTGDRVIIVTVSTVVLLSLVTFLWPLLGIHQLLEVEKDRVEVEIKQRIKRAIADVHQSIDTQRPTDLEAPAKAMTVLKEELAFIETISTWPWQPDTIRGLATALLLPVVLWFITRALERLFAF